MKKNSLLTKDIISEKHILLFALLLTIIGLAMSIEYVKFSHSNFIHFVMGFSLLCIPAIYVVFRASDKSSTVIFTIFLILITVSFGQYLQAFGSNYVEGTDGPFVYQRAISLIDQSGKFQLYDESKSISMQFPGIHLFINSLAILLGKPLKYVCLYIVPSIGVLSSLTFFLIIRLFLSNKMALIACILASWNLTFVGYGMELRPENFGLLFFMIMLFVIIRKNISMQNRIAYSITAIIVGFAVIISHSVAAVHTIFILSIFVYSFYIYKEKLIINKELIHIIVLLSFVSYLIFMSGSFGNLIHIFSDIISDLFSSGATKIFESKGFRATNAGTLTFLIMWLERILFLIGFFMLMQKLRNIKNRDNLSTFNYFIFLWASIYLIVIIILILANSLNPERLYRFFAFPAAIIESFPLFSIIHNSNKSFIQIKPSILRLVSVLFIGLIMMNSLLVQPNWIINTQLNENHEKPYAHFADQDICAAKFAKCHIDQIKIIGGFRTALVFGAIGNVEIIKLDYIVPDKKILNETDMARVVRSTAVRITKKPLFMDLRADHKKYINYEESIIENTSCIYNNQQVLINLLSID